MPALIPKEDEIQIQKNMVHHIAVGLVVASVKVDNFVDGSFYQTFIRDSAFTPDHWIILPFHFISLYYQLDGEWQQYNRKVPVLIGPNNSTNAGLKMTILDYLASMFTIGVNEMLHFLFAERIFAVPNHRMFNMGIVEHSWGTCIRGPNICLTRREGCRNSRWKSVRCREVQGGHRGQIVQQFNSLRKHGAKAQFLIFLKYKVTKCRLFIVFLNKFTHGS